MRKLIVSLTIALAIMLNAAAQERTLSGKITDEKGLPIEGVSITSPDGKHGTQTDLQGNYKLSLPTSVSSLSFTSVNFETMVLSVKGNVLNGTMVSFSGKLEEVVVTALGIARDKRSLGYATQTIKGDQMADRGEVNIVNALQGKVAGVNITGASGAAGASTNINIR